MSVIIVPKSAFKPKVFEYLRRVESGDQVCITDHGRPVVDLLPHRVEDDKELEELRGLVLKYDQPTDPLDVNWEVDR